MGREGTILFRGLARSQLLATLYGLCQMNDLPYLQKGLLAKAGLYSRAKLHSIVIERRYANFWSSVGSMRFRDSRTFQVEAREYGFAVCIYCNACEEPAPNGI